MRFDQPEMEDVPPCRILMRAGVEVDEMVTERPRQEIVFRRTDIPAPDDSKPSPAQARIQGLTPAAVMAWLGEGRSIPAIARSFGCQPDTVREHMAKWRLSDPGFRAFDDRAQKCGCGGLKRRHEALCGFCASKKRRAGR